MPQIIRDVMTENPVVMQTGQTATEAARRMRDDQIGCVLVSDGDRLRGIVTDRDLVVRCIAIGQDPRDTHLESLCSSELVTAGPTDEVDAVIGKMRQRAVRRIPVVQDGKPIGIVTLGDLCIARDKQSLLGSISSAPANA